MCLPSLSGSNLEKKNRSNNFRETSEKYLSKMLNLEEEEEEKEKIFEVKEISKEKNKLEEQVFAYNIPPCIAVVGSHHRDLN